MFRNVAILVIVCTLNGMFADDIPDECKVHQAFKMRPHECCDVPRMVSEQDEKDCGLAPDGDMSVEQSHPRPPGPPSCESDICLLKKYDLLSGDNKVNKKAVIAFIEKWSTAEPEFAPLIDSIKSECVDKDITATGPPDVCEPLKMRRCLIKTAILECPKWKSTVQCTEIKQHVDKCKQYYKKAA